MGKRVEQAARTVVGPDPTLRTGWIAVPPKVARILTAKERVTRYNHSRLQATVDGDRANAVVRGADRINLKYATARRGTVTMSGDVITRTGDGGAPYSFDVVERGEPLVEGDKLLRNEEEIPYVLHTRRRFLLKEGDTVDRQLHDGDRLVLNRQPTLHKPSMMSHRIRVKPNKTFRMPLAVTKPYNADFDGDEMNTHAAQSEVAKMEVEILSSVSSVLTSSQSSKLNIAIVQDSLLGCYLMTRDRNTIQKEDFWDVCGVGIGSHFRTAGAVLKRLREIERVLRAHGKDPSPYTGRGLFSMTLPSDFYYYERNDAARQEPHLWIERGVIVEGAVCKSELGGGHRSITRSIVKEYGIDTAMDLLDDVQFISNSFLLKRGFTIGIEDCIATRQEEISAATAKCFIQARMAEETIRNPRIREARINEALSRARDIGMRLSKDALGESNNFTSTVTAGSKGDFFNIAQIAGLLGQQNFNGGRIKPALNKGRRPLVHCPFGGLSDREEFLHKGFVAGSFLRGLSPCETWYHAVTGREGVTNTAMMTARSGYIQRKMTKLSEDLVARYDGTVRGSRDQIIQFAYGEDGYDGAETVVVGGLPVACNAVRICQRLNAEHERTVALQSRWKKLVTGLKARGDPDYTDQGIESDYNESESERSLSSDTDGSLLSEASHSSRSESCRGSDSDPESECESSSSESDSSGEGSDDSEDDSDWPAED